MKSYLLPLGILLFAGLASRPASADTFFFENTNDTTGAPCSATVPCAEVQIDNLGSGLFKFTVSSLESGFIFDTFGFNGPAGLVLQTTGANAPSGEVTATRALNGSGNEDGWGTFAWNFDTGESGGSDASNCVVTGGVPNAHCTFTFVVQAGSSATDASFEVASSGGSGSGDFAGHFAAADSSGFVGDPVPFSAPTPEPSSLMLLGTGALALAGLVRRRYGK